MIIDSLLFMGKVTTVAAYILMQGNLRNKNEHVNELYPEAGVNRLLWIT